MGRWIIVYLTMVALARERPINLLPGRRWPAKGGSEEEFGQNPKCGTGKDLLICCVRLSLFLRTSFNISTRIPLQPQCAHWGSFSPGEA